MSEASLLTPRVIIVRHGETEWARIGRYTGISDIELTQKGEHQVSSTALALVGNGKFLDPRRLTHVYVSPRKRAIKTFELLHSGVGLEIVTFTEDIAEWNYGEYEGMKDAAIRELRKSKGLDSDKEWNIFADGCEQGESPQQVTKRLDTLIDEIREQQKPYMRGEKPADVLVVAHGSILRAFTKRWLNWSLDLDIAMEIQPGGMAVLSYKHNDINQPCLVLGLALP